MKLSERITELSIHVATVLKTIAATLDKTIQKTTDNKYPALDGSNITNLALKINELTTDPIELTDGKVWLIRTQQDGGIIQQFGFTPMSSDTIDKTDLKIKTSKGVGTINITY